MEKLMSILPQYINKAIKKLNSFQISNLTEIRLRVNKPAYMYISGIEYGINENGISKYDGIIFSKEDSSEYSSAFQAYVRTLSVPGILSASLNFLIGFFRVISTNFFIDTLSFLLYGRITLQRKIIDKYHGRGYFHNFFRSFYQYCSFLHLYQ